MTAILITFAFFAPIAITVAFNVASSPRAARSISPMRRSRRVAYPDPSGPIAITVASACVMRA